MATNEQVRDGAWLALGLNPNWQDLPSVEDLASIPGPPVTVGSGVDVTDVVLALMRVQLRENPAKQRAWVSVTTVANSQTYTVTINGNAHNYVSDASATEAEILAGLKAAIEAGSEPVTVTETTREGSNVIQVESDTIATFTLTTSATGSGALADTVEATSATFTVWTTGKALTIPDRADGYESTTTTNNWTQRIEIGGYREVYLEVTSTDGLVVLQVAPCEED